MQNNAACMHASEYRPNQLGLASLSHIYAYVIAAIGKRK